MSGCVNDIANEINSKRAVYMQSIFDGAGRTEQYRRDCAGLYSFDGGLLGDTCLDQSVLLTNAGGRHRTYLVVCLLRARGQDTVSMNEMCRDADTTQLTTPGSAQNNSSVMMVQYLGIEADSPKIAA